MRNTVFGAAMILAVMGSTTLGDEPGPKYLDLRWNEDFSYLDRPDGKYREDLFDPIKYMDVGEDWRLTLGGEFRFQLHSETNKAFGSTEPANDTFQLYRILAHADLRHADGLRIFAQGIMAFDEDRDLAPRGIDENKWDLHQLFADVMIDPAQSAYLRLGRQELLYGNERYVSPLEWAGVRRRFDGVKLAWRAGDWDVDLWFVRPIPVQRKQFDDWNEDVDFYGLYTTYHGWSNHAMDCYLLAIDDQRNLVNPNGSAGDRNVYTLGSRFWGNTGDYDYEAELAGQWGHWAGDRIRAWSVAIDGGYTMADDPARPRIGVGFDWAGGDEDPTDRSIETFDQLFPLSHKYLGFLDLVGRRNVTAVNVNLSAWPVPGEVKARAAYHAFWLTEKKDAQYGAGGGAGRRDPFGSSGNELGQELDLTLQCKLNVHASLLLGYSHFWNGAFVIDTGPDQDADLFYIQYQYKF